MRKKRFTLLEVLVAMAVLGISLVMIMAILGSGRNRILRAQRSWGREHLLTQATEFYLLAGPEATPPPGLLPEGYSSSCQIEEARELPDIAREPINNVVLRVYQIRLYGLNGEVLEERKVERVIYEEL